MRGSFPRPFYGWWIIAASIILVWSSASVVAYGFPVLISPIQSEFGWGTPVLALAFSLRSQVRSLGAIPAGFLVDRYGSRAMIACGIFIAGLGFLFLSRIDSHLTLYAAFIVISIGGSLCNPSIPQVSVAKWFTRWRTRALTIQAVGQGFGGLTAPLLAFLVDKFGWRGGLVALTTISWSMAAPVLLTYRDRPEPYGMLPDGVRPEEAGATTEQTTSRRRALPPSGPQMTVREVVTNRRFWHLLGASTLHGLGSTPVMTLLVAGLLVDGIEPSMAFMTFASIPLVSIPGRLVFGWWGDKFDKRKVIAFSYTMQAIGLIILANATSPLLLAAFVLTYASSSGGTGTLTTSLQVDFFGTRAMGSVHGLLQGFAILDTMVAPIFVAFLADLLGSYRLPWLVLSVCMVLAIPVLLTTPRALPATVVPSAVSEDPKP